MKGDLMGKNQDTNLYRKYDDECVWRKMCGEKREGTDEKTEF